MEPVLQAPAPSPEQAANTPPAATLAPRDFRRVLEDQFRTSLVKVTVFVDSMSIRYKIAAVLVAVLCMAIASLGRISFAQQKRVLENELVQRGEILARQVAAAGKTGLLTHEEL